MINIAVLITCYNRKSTTIKCLSALYNQIWLHDIKLNTYLVDDGSSDGTSDALKDLFPQVNIIEGNGNLFWNRGMRLAWETAINQNDYDFYLWLNDDVFLFEDGIYGILNDYKSIKEDAILVGIIKDPLNNNTSYSGYRSSLKLDPKDSVQVCDTFNGNVVLIPRGVFNKVGLLDNSFSHWFGDTDYGWRARKMDIKSYVTTNYVGEGKNNIHGADWANPKYSLLKRIKILNSPKGLPPREWFIYSKRVYGNFWPLSFVKIFLRLLSPTLYGKFKKIYNQI